MKVVHVISCPLQSGAGRAVLALHEALLAQGVDSHVLGRIEYGLPAKLRTHPATRLQKIPTSIANRLYLWYLRCRFKIDLNNFHPVSFGLKIFKDKVYRDADVIHVQFAAASTIGPSFWRSLCAETRPVIWTLRDMWTFTGGCHFSGSCNRYTSNCGSCPQLGGSAKERVTSQDLAFKAAHIGDSTTFVASSRVTADEARGSFVLKDRDIRILPNAVMLNHFAEIDGAEARMVMGLPRDKMILAVGAVNLADPRKGSETLKYLLKEYGDDRSVHWAIFGRNLSSLVEKIPENCTFFGWVDDPKTLNLLYAAADIYLMPSLHESFGKTTVEAMASRTPVIAYNDTPAEEILRHGETGWLVPHANRQRFFETVRAAMAEGPEKLAEMGGRASKDVRERFALKVVAERHIALYNERLSEQFLHLSQLDLDDGSQK